MVWWGGRGKHFHVEWHCSHLFSPMWGAGGDQVICSFTAAQEPLAAAISHDCDKLCEIWRGKKKKRKKKTHLGESVRAGGELPQLHVEVLVVGVLLLRLQVVVPLGASWRWNEWIFFFRAKMTSGQNAVNLSLRRKKKKILNFFSYMEQTLERKVRLWPPRIAHQQFGCFYQTSFLTFFHLQSQLQFQG